MQSSSGQAVSYAAAIKPLFRETDRESMIHAFDLWSYDDVKAHVGAILERVSDGTMPCDEEWPKERVELFRRWVGSGMAE